MASKYQNMLKGSQQNLSKIDILNMISSEEQAIKMYSEALTKLNKTYEADASKTLKEILREEIHHKEELNALL